MKKGRTYTSVQKKVQDFFSLGEQKTYKKGSIILSPGKSVSSLYFVSSGYVRMVHKYKQHDIVSLHLFRPGCFFPLLQLRNKKMNQYTFEAVSTVSVFEVPSAMVLKFLYSNPDVLLDVTTRLLSGIQGLLLRLTLLTNGSAYEKIYSLLIYVSESIGVSEKDGIRIPISLTHTDIASWVGITRETASLNMEKLVKEGRIGYSGRTLFVKKRID